MSANYVVTGMSNSEKGWMDSFALMAAFDEAIKPLWCSQMSGVDHSSSDYAAALSHTFNF